MYGTPVFATVTEQFPIASTQYGKVTGETVEGVAVFRGIPYGGRCDRERRFLPPEPPEAWDGVMDCTKNGPICVQKGGSASDFYGTGGKPEKLKLQYETQDENCLCLNVLTPGLDGKKRPVLFYIHGGGYSILSGTLLTGADALCREQDVVLVSVNHRLHYLGYLYLGELDPKYEDSGNVGHLDLILALQWVRDNIGAFGGDPECVTIMGESGGSDKVINLLHMPEAQGLFHRAIAISCFLPVGRLTKEVCTRYTREMLELLEVSPDHLEKLQELPARYILDKIYDPATRFWSMSFGPVMDGKNIFPGKGEGFVPSAFTSSVPVLLGASEEEMANFRVEESFDVTEENLREKLLERGPSFGLPFTEENVDEVIEVFRRNNPKHDTADHLFMKILSIKCHMGRSGFMAEDLVKNGSAPVYHYLNRYDAPNNGHPARRYAGHCMEMVPSFRMVAYPHMEEYSKTVSAAFSAFIRTGDPSTAGLPWPRFTTEGKETMVFDRESGVVCDPLGEEYAALDRVTGDHGVVDSFSHKQYKWPLKMPE